MGDVVGAETPPSPARVTVRVGVRLHSDGSASVPDSVAVCCCIAHIARIRAASTDETLLGGVPVPLVRGPEDVGHVCAGAALQLDFEATALLAFRVDHIKVAAVFQ